MKFSSVITLSTSRTADPASAGIERFVGLEYIEPENLLRLIRLDPRKKVTIWILMKN